MTVANIDCDVLCYAIGATTNEHPFLKDQEGKALKMPCTAEYVETLIEPYLDQITKDAQCDTYKCFISGPTNFRKEIAVTFPYKGKRSAGDRPFHYQTVRDYFINNLDPVISDNREADDDLADHQTEDTVLCTVDKDLDMVVGKHYNWKKEEQGVYEVDEIQGHHWFCYQLLVGDWTTDAILGCANLVEKVYGPKAAKAGQTYTTRVGVGPKTAEQLLSATTHYEKLSVVMSQYQKLFGSEAETKLNEMARLLWMGGSADNLWTWDKLDA